MGAVSSDDSELSFWLNAEIDFGKNLAIKLTDSQLVQRPLWMSSLGYDNYRFVSLAGVETRINNQGAQTEGAPSRGGRADQRAGL